MQTKTGVVYVPSEIVRIDAENRVVELYAYVNAIVPTQKWDLTRAAMEEATADYMKWANVREMHDPKRAAGVTQSAVWDEKGCKLSVEVVDDVAWQKVEKGVYKGGSVGIIPTVVKENQIRRCIWHETSLVDRPADADALILNRSETQLDAEEEYECDVEIARADPPAADPPADPPADPKPADPAPVERAEEVALAILVQRAEAQSTEIADLKRQLAEADVTQVRTLKAEVERLKSLPMRYQPVRFTDALTGMERRFTTMNSTPRQAQAEGEAQDCEKRMKEIQRMSQDPETKLTEAERIALSMEFGQLKNKYARAVATAATANALGRFAQ